MFEKQAEKSKTQITELKMHVLKVANALKVANMRLSSQGEQIITINDEHEQI